MNTTQRILPSFSHLCNKKIRDITDLMGVNSSERWELWDTSLFIPFDDCAANSISKAANRSRTARNQPWIKIHQKQKGKRVKQIYNFQGAEQAILHGPNQAIPVANNDPKSWPSVAPAPMNPNNLEPD